LIIKQACLLRTTRPRAFEGAAAFEERFREDSTPSKCGS
jgi:hypothetical protein